MKMFRFGLGFVYLVMGLFLAACGNTSTSTTGQPHNIEHLPKLEAVAFAKADEKLRVVATTSIVGDVVAQVGGEAIELTVLLKPGQDPHAYQPSAQELSNASNAHVIFMNGFDLEESLIEDLASAAEGVPIVAVSVGIEPIEEETNHDEEGHHHLQNPHVWFNVLHVERWTYNIEQVLSDLQPAHAETYTSHAQTYRTELATLDKFVRQTLHTIPEQNRRLVTNHDAFTYLADAYRLEIIGTIIPTFSTNAEPSASNLSQLIETIKEEQVSAIFIDSSASQEFAQVVADETGAAVFELYTEALGAEGSGADSYIGMMQTNVETIRDALSE